MNVVQEILTFKKDPREDYYGILGCDRTSTKEQILAEYKVRAKDLHPDKNARDTRDDFQTLQAAKEVLADDEERVKYDRWMDSGLAMSYKQWRGMKDAVKTSMHWAMPRTQDRMLEEEKREEESRNSLLQTPSPVPEMDEEQQQQEDKELDEIAAQADEDVVYKAVPYEQLGMRVASPDPEWQWDIPLEERKEYIDSIEEIEKVRNEVRGGGSGDSRPKLKSTASFSSSPVDVATALKRQQFAQRRDSSIATMMMVEPYSDEEMRRRFRNYEI